MYDTYLVYSVEDSVTYKSTLYKSTYSVGKDNDVTLGDAEEVVQRTVYDTVAMALFSINDDGAEEGDVIVRSGKIFEVGRYEDKEFELTSEEAAAAIEGFSPVSVDYEHITGPLDGHLGRLRKVWMGSDGISIMGEYEEPTWLSKVLGNAARKVSTTWDRSTKQLKGLALVTNPRVADAAVMAAFAGARHNKEDQVALNAAHDALVTAGAECNPQKETNMGDDKDKGQNVMEWLSGVVGNAFMGQLRATNPPAADPTTTPPVVEDTRVATLEKQMAAFRAESYRALAVTFVDGLLRDERILPAERDTIIAAYIMAAEDDLAVPREVSFTVGEEQKKGTRVDALMAQYNARPAHLLTKEMLDPNLKVGDVLLSTGTNPPASDVDQKEMDAILSATPLGRAMLKERTAANGKQ